MKIDLSSEEINILKDVLEDHVDVIRDYYDVEEYKIRAKKEEELLDKLSRIDNETN
jgi:ppGpp synthetase/RelA/SpoT-type nucleotidyltranferase